MSALDLPLHKKHVIFSPFDKNAPSDFAMGWDGRKKHDFMVTAVRFRQKKHLFCSIPGTFWRYQ